MPSPHQKSTVSVRVECLQTREAPAVPGPPDTQAPSVSFVTPTAVSILRDVTTVQAQASDNVGVARVEFYLDGSFRARATQAPYNWSFDTRASANGSHLLKA